MFFCEFVFRRNACTRQILESFYHVDVFFTRKRFTWNFVACKKVMFLLKSLVCSFCSITFAEKLPSRWHLGDTLPPTASLIFPTDQSKTHQIQTDMNGFRVSGHDLGNEKRKCLLFAVIITFQGQIQMPTKKTANCSFI